jgi:hypothetical protein
MPAPDGTPSGLSPDHVLLAVDYLVHHPALEGVYDPRLVTLSADGTLVIERRDRDVVMGATRTLLDAGGFTAAWSSILRSGVFANGSLGLAGVPDHAGRTDTSFRVDDGAQATRLVIQDLGSEQVYSANPPISADEVARRAAASRLIDELRLLGSREPWTPPSLLLWWRSELPADWNATVVPWPLSVDLSTAGQPIDHPVWSRCARFDGADAAAVAAFARSVPIDHLVERDGKRHVISVRPIHEDEIGLVAGP